MNKRARRPLYKRIAIDVAGFGLLLAALLTAWLPGPGGIPLLIAGLGLLSLNYEWAEKLLKDFEKKRQEMADKYLNVSREVSIAIDVVSILIITGSIYVLANTNTWWIQGFSAGFALAAVVLLLSNQKRAERLISLIKK